MNNLLMDIEHILCLKHNDGVLFGIGSESEIKSLDWLARRFRYANYGCALSLHRKISMESRVKPIKLPFQNAEIIVEQIAAYAKMEYDAVESVALASSLASPLLILSRQCLPKLKPIVTYTFKADLPLSERELGFNIRYCCRSAVDLFAISTRLAQDAIQKKIEYDNAIFARRTSAKEDAKRRFWRLGNGTQGNPFVVYLDLLPVIIKACSEKVTFFPILSIIVAIVVEI